MNNNYLCCNGYEDYYNFQIPAVKLKFVIEAMKSGKMPYYAGSVIRGMLGKKIRELSCVDHRADCKSCPHMKGCAYGKLFEPLSSVFAPELMSTQLYLTPPFVIEAPTFEENCWNEGEEKEFHIILFGNSAHEIHYFIESLFLISKAGLGKNRIPFQIKSISQILQNKEAIKLLTGDQVHYEKIVMSEYRWRIEEPTYKKVLINIDNPLRIQEEGKIIEDFDLEIFLKNCERRIQYLCKVFQIPYLIPENYIEHIKDTVILSNKQIMWQDWQRYSGRTKKMVNLGGIVGTFCLEGKGLVQLLPILHYASFAHIGKQTVFGLGKFSIWTKLKD